MRTRPATPCARGELGFTLIEMIVALALLSLIMGVLAGSIKVARNVLGAVERTAVANTALPAQSYLRAAFAQTVPARLSTTSADRSPVLVGDATRVRFKTFYATLGQLEGLYTVDIRLEPGRDRDGFDLVAIQALQRPAAADGSVPDAPSRRSVLATNVRAIRIGYFGTSETKVDDWQWVDAWTSADRLPRLVRIDLTFQPGQGQNWRRVHFPIQLAE